MTITNIVKLVNSKLNYENFSYDDMRPELDDAIDELNVRFRSSLPLIGDLPEVSVDPINPSITKAVEYNSVDTEIIRRFIVPYTASLILQKVGRDNRPETMEYTTNFTKLSQRFDVEPGATSISKVNNGVRGIMVEDTKDEFMSGHNNYGGRNEGPDPYTIF